MTQALVCMSHSPLLGRTHPPAEVVAAVDAAFEQVRAFVRDFDPDVVVNLCPDHYHGFFYDLMPPYCIGLAAHGVGGYRSFPGGLKVPYATSESLAQQLLDRSVDVASSPW